MIPKRYLIAGIALLLLTVGFVSLNGLAGAAEKPVKFNLGTSAPPKSDDHIRANMAFDILEGGETIGSALPILGLPFNDTGATCDNIDDYDEVCPYTGSTAPDVVYSYMPAGNMTVTIDLFGSTYDTKVYVYDAGLSLIACNDDFYPDYTSKIESLSLTGGITYYIVIDGYGSDCGDYALDISEDGPCVVVCPVGGIPEGEPPLVDEYIDMHNGGCNSVPAVFQFLDQANVGPDTTLICGVSGWYDFGGSDYRDTDWYVVTIGAGGVVEVTVEPEYDTYIFELYPLDCPTVGVVQNVIAAPCSAATLQILGHPGSTAWFFVGPTTYDGPVNEYPYNMWVSGHEATPGVDVTPPEITVELNRDCLWPPNHKMADIIATVTVTDNLCPNPTFVLTSVTSNEPDNGAGDGNTVDDIQDADIGTSDTQIRLRSERSGQGDGRVYTIVYTATDCAGNTADATVEVRVPHDMAGGACASMGFVLSGIALDPMVSQFALVIRSNDGFDATALDVKTTYVGNLKGVAKPERSMEIDNNVDGLTDLVVFYSARALSVLRDRGPIGLHYRSGDGVDYLVPDIFNLGEPVPVVPVIEIPRRRNTAGEGEGAPSVTALRSAYPNPFNPSTTIPFSVVSQGQVSLRIYDAQGKLVRTLRNDVVPAGQHEAVWDGRDNFGNQMATGVYFVRFVAGSYEMTRKVVMLK